MTLVYNPVSRVVQEQGCYTPASAPAASFFAEYPEGVVPGFNASWEYSEDGGVTYSTPAEDSVSDVVGPAGTQRFRQPFSIPFGIGGTFDVTISGDIFNAVTNDPGHIWYDGVDQGPIVPIAGPQTLTFLATPGFHVYEFRHGAVAAPLGLIVPTITVDYTLTTSSPLPFTVQVVTVVDQFGNASGVTYYDTQGFQIIPQPGDSVAIGPCGGAVTPPVSSSSQHFEVLPGTPWTPALVVGTVTGLTYTIVSGTGSVTDSNGTVITTLPVGYSASWNSDDAGTLSPPTSIASVGGRVIVHWSEK